MSTNDPNQSNDHVPSPSPSPSTFDPNLVETFGEPGMYYKPLNQPSSSNQSTYQQWPTQSPPPSTNNLAVASLVLGILWVFWIGSALAVIFGHIALKEIKRRGESGQGLAVAGLVLGYVGAGTFVLFFLLPLMLSAGA